MNMRALPLPTVLRLKGSLVHVKGLNLRAVQIKDLTVSWPNGCLTGHYSKEGKKR